MGSDSSGSAVVALLEIARLFSILYSSPKTRGRYNLLFALTSGGPYNYNGTHKVLILKQLLLFTMLVLRSLLHVNDFFTSLLQWIHNLDQRLRETIDYAICLNSIGSSGNELWLHVSKPPANANIKHIFEVDCPSLL